MYKKIITFLLLIFSIICYSEKISQNSEICEYFRDKESKKKFNPYTGKTNIKLKNGVYKCLNADASFKIIVWRYFWADNIDIYGTLTIEVKNGIMTKFESIDEKNGELLFSATYNGYGPNGEMYISKGFALNYNSNSRKLNYKDGKLFGDILEYYDNGKLYRKSHLVKKNNYHPFDTPDDFNDYIDYYEIYDINTGEILKKENLFNKTGTIWDYDSKSGKLYIESHLVNGKIVFQREYKEDGTVAREYNYKK